MNNGFIKILIVAASGYLFFSACYAAQTVYTPPVIPPGVFRSTIPAAREEWMAQVQDKFNKSSGKQFDLIFDGGSFISDWVSQGRGLEVWNAHYAGLKAFDFGINGDFVQNVLWRLQQGQLDGIKPKMVVLMVGTNNLPLDAPDKIAEGIKVLLAEYQKDAPNAKILLLAAPPQGVVATAPARAKISQLNNLIAALADGQQVVYLDIGSTFLNSDGSLSKDMFAPDMVHPNAKFFQAWAQAMQPEIDKVFSTSVTTSPAP